MKRPELLADDIAAERYRSIRALFMRNGARPPFLLWQPSEVDLPAPELVEFLRLWNHLRGEAAAPPAASFDPAALGPAAAYVASLDVVGQGQDFIYQYYGTALARAYGCDATGRMVSSFNATTTPFLLACYQAAMRRPEPLYTEHEPPQGIFVGQWDRLILPLVAADGRVSRIVAASLPEAPLRTLVDTVMDPVLVLDDAGIVRLANGHATSLLSIPEASLVGQPGQAILPDSFGPDGLPRVGTASEARARRGDGVLVAVEISVGLTRRARRALFVCVLRDLTLRKATEDRYRNLAFTDPLTGLANRFLFHERMEQALARARRDRHRVALFLLDLDAFKEVNDVHGHVAGDRVLQELARRLRGSLREVDVLARLGGDEFAIVQTTVVAEEAAITLADRLVALFADPFEIGPPAPALQISASIGIALYPDDAALPLPLIERADRALYAAKRSRDRRHVRAGHEPD